eukprot:12343626-Karenia_brevis.AAC.1
MASGKTWDFSRRRGVFEADFAIVSFASSKYASQLAAKTLRGWGVFGSQGTETQAQGTGPCVASLQLYR